MSIFSETDFQTIERLAAGLSMDEVLAIYYTKQDELSQSDHDLFARSYNKGRAMAKSVAVQNLFNSMSGKEGVKGALSYLTRFGAEWPIVEEEKKGGKHVFTIEMPK